jgi:hypothetical protein
MALDRRTYLYEILVRLDQNGIKGAHVVDLEEIYDTESGEIIQAKPLPARPVTTEEIAPLLGAGNVAVIEQIDGLNRQAEEAKAAAAAQADALAAALARAEAAEAALANIREIAAQPSAVAADQRA